MAMEAQTDGGRRGVSLRFLGWSAAAALLLLPLVAMQFTTEVTWDGADFIFAGILIGGTGLAIEGVVRKTDNWAYRFAAMAALAATFLTIWVNAAVGMIGSEDNPLNLLFGGVLGLALVGALLARLRPAGMARAMALAGAAQLSVSVVGMYTDLRGGLLSALFAAVWLLSAAMFRKAARGSRSYPAG